MFTDRNFAATLDGMTKKIAQKEADKKAEKFATALWGLEQNLQELRRQIAQADGKEFDLANPKHRQMYAAMGIFAHMLFVAEIK